MLHARKAGFWTGCYEITAEEQVVARWEPSIWRTGGRFELDGRHYEIRANLWGNRYGMNTENGTVVASADRVGRKNWTVEAAGRVYTFQRASWWRPDQILYVEGHPAGSITRPSIWRSDALTDLPGLAVPVQIFVLAVVLTMWSQQAGTASAASS